MRTGPPTVVLATTNGKGMGHLSRQLALALASLGGMNPVIFSLSAAVPVVGRFGMRAEWCPSGLRGQVSRRDWDGYLADRIVALIEEVGASAFVFDGVYPYDGVLRALRRSPGVPFIWSRRAMWQRGVGGRALRFRRLFAAVLEPGDLAAAGDLGPTARLDDARRVGPVTLAGHVPALARSTARAALGLDPDRPAVLLALGSTRRSDAYAAHLRTVQRFSEAGWQVAATSSPIRESERPASGGNHQVRTISVFPLVSYLAAFDAAVAAGGYNAVHELVYSAVPALFVPNSDAVTDDQGTRARVVADAGLALQADPDDAADFDAALGRLLDPTDRRRLVTACRQVPPTTGATEAARTVIGLAASGPPDAAERMDAAALHAHRFARRQVGRVVPAPVAAMIGRPRIRDASGPGSFDVVVGPVPAGEPVSSASGLPPERDGELLVTDALLPGLFDHRPVEHLISRAGPEYVRARAEIAHRYYRLRSAVATEDPRGQEWLRSGWGAG